MDPLTSPDDGDRLFAGIPLTIDPHLPPDTIEFRDPQGRPLARINLNQQENP